VSISGSGVSGREALVTLVACALLGFESGWSLLMGFAVLFQIGLPPYLLSSALGLISGCVVGVVLLRQGGVSIPSGGERGASSGALAGLVVGVVAIFLLGGAVVGLLGTCVLVGLAIGRAFDRSSVHRGAL
jgi:hypothetical protein